MIGSLMYLTASRHDIMYLKGKPKLGLWYPRVSSFDLESYSDSDYAGANLDRKSTIGGCQFLGRRLISWQCKKQTIVATSTTEAEYVAAASCCGQVLWIQNQMLDYGFNFMNTKIYIDNESTIFIVKNPVYHSKTKHIAIRHHFIRDAYEKKLIQVLKIHTNDNVADLLTKAFDVSWFQFLVVSIGMLNQTLISLFTTITLPTTMAVLESCPKHNMVAYLEKTEGNAEFHEIIDFLKRSSIHHALTSQNNNNVRHITAKVAGKSVSISEASIRSDLLFDDADGIDSLPNQAIFDAIQLMGYEEDLTVSDQAKEIHHLKALVKKLKKQANPSVSKQGRKFAKGESSVQRDPLFDEIPEDTVDHMETENAQDEGRTRDIVDEDKEIEENVLSTEDVLSTDKDKVSTDRPMVSTDGSKVSTDMQIKAKVLLNMSQAKAVSREKEKGVELKDIEETDRPRPTSTRSLLTLKPLPKIDPKDKGKKKIEEEDESESESDEEWEGEEERNRIAEEKATNEALIRNFDDIKARIEADRLLAEKLQEQEREQFTIEERAKFLHDTIAAQRKFLAQQRSEAIRNRPPTKNQLRNQMMTYLKHVGNFKHAELKIKKFEKNMSCELDSSKSFWEKSDQEENKKKPREENKKRQCDELRFHLTIAPVRKKSRFGNLDRKLTIKEWKIECLGTKPQDDKAKNLEEINQNVVIRSNGQKRYFSTLMRVLSIFDREDLNDVYQLVMDRYQDEIPEGFDRVLWGDLMVMFNPDDEDKFWNSQQDWNIVSWKLHGSSGVHTLVTETGLVIHMLVEKKYPLIKKVMVQMLKLKLESEEDSTMALELIRFIKKLLAELEHEE
ncbi:hypothetical protein Tco_0179768 [Tanacetum coccineum]